MNSALLSDLLPSVSSDIRSYFFERAESFAGAVFLGFGASTGAAASVDVSVAVVALVASIPAEVAPVAVMSVVVPIALPVVSAGTAVAAAGSTTGLVAVVEVVEAVPEAPVAVAGGVISDATPAAEGAAGVSAVTAPGVGAGRVDVSAGVGVSILPPTPVVETLAPASIVTGAADGGVAVAVVIELSVEVAKAGAANTVKTAADIKSLESCMGNLLKSDSEDIASPLNIEAEKHDIAIRHNIFFAFLTCLARFLGALLAFVSNIIRE